jgi:hypothetical protein
MYQILIGSAGYQVPPLPWYPSTNQWNVEITAFPELITNYVNPYHMFDQIISRAETVCNPQTVIEFDFLSPTTPATMVITAEVRNYWLRSVELYHKDFTQSENWRIINLLNNFEIDVNYQKVTIDVGVSSKKNQAGVF